MRSLSARMLHKLVRLTGSHGAESSLGGMS